MKTRGKNTWTLKTNLLALTAVAGLLIWAKLRLVTNFPRTVLADPEQREVEEPGEDTSAPHPAVDPENE
ncbi:MAG: hypothetical protein DYG94_06220 [Leptolyngbya sp. PLA3]|nr:MAG: hypothetical protein EDM82_03350 [Cyanobacteria bacterium CYA]MCE7968325.1 hypothetical protein [Leptolyngbya sp. PL-A3]